jgi:WD40 repeat protein
MIQFWDVRTGNMIATIGSLEGNIKAITLSPDDKLLAASIGTDEDIYTNIYIWDVISQKQLAEFETSQGGGMSLTFSPDSTLLASNGMDGVVRLWSVDQGAQ